MSDPRSIFAQAVQSLAVSLAQEHATVIDGPEKGRSLWPMLTSAQQNFFAAQQASRARDLLLAGAAQHEEVDRSGDVVSEIAIAESQDQVSDQDSVGPTEEPAAAQAGPSPKP